LKVGTSASSTVLPPLVTLSVTAFGSGIAHSAGQLPGPFE
jgi:hypothetical protein